VHFRFGIQGLVAFAAVLVLATSVEPVGGQENNSRADLEKSMGLITRFFDDWRKTRRPLSQLHREAMYHRELVADDLFDRLKQHYASLDHLPASPPLSDTPGQLKPSELVRANITSSEEKFEYPYILRSADMPVIGHVDCEIDYQCMCSPENLYNAIQIEAVPVLLPRRRTGSLLELGKLVDDVRQIPKGRFYDCYSVTNHHERFESEMRCRFLDVLTAEENISAIQNVVKNTNIPVLKSGGLSELAIENAVRVRKSDRRPLGRASEFVRPIYAIIDDKTYLFEEIYSDPGIRCALTKVFEHPIFDVSVCSNKTSCSAAAMGTFLTNVDVEMKQNPVAADFDMQEQSLPGERNYVRNYKPSVVLGGAFYESSQYILQWYRNQIGRVGPPEFYTYSKGQTDFEGDFLFARIRLSLSVRPGLNGPYPEASLQQYSAYEEAIQATVTKAVSSTCRSIANASLEANTCKLPKDQ
jgi:hypothetical protein